MSDKLKRWFGVAGKRTVLSVMAATMLCGLAGCAKNEISNSTSENSADISQSIPSEESKTSNSSKQVNTHANYGDDNAENGPFISEEAYNEICQNIIIGEKKISFPCTISELNPEFTLGGVPVIQKDLKLATYLLMYGTESIGSCTIRYTVDSEKFNADDIEQINDCMMTGISFNSDSCVTPDFGWLSFKTGMETVLNNLGEPTERFDSDDGTYILTYQVNDDSVVEKSIMLMFNSNNQIYDVGLCWE